MSKIGNAALRRKSAAAPEAQHRIPRVANATFDFGVLTRGGAHIHERTHLPIATCNLLANLAGLGTEEAD